MSINKREDDEEDEDEEEDKEYVCMYVYHHYRSRNTLFKINTQLW